MNTKNAFSTLLAVLITAVIVGVLVGVISYSYAASKKDLEIEDLREQLNQIKEEETSVEPGGMSLDTSGTDNQQPTTKTPSTATTDETANWKTYANEKYGFSFKYPEEWKIKINMYMLPENSQKGNVDGKIVFSPNDDKQQLSLWINPAGFGLENRSDEYKAEIDQNNNIIITDKKTYVNDKNSEIEIIGLATVDPFTYKNNEYLITYNFDLNNRINELRTFDQILSTFQFTKKSF